MPVSLKVWYMIWNKIFIMGLRPSTIMGEVSEINSEWE